MMAHGTRLKFMDFKLDEVIYTIKRWVWEKPVITKHIVTGLRKYRKGDKLHEELYLDYSEYPTWGFQRNEFCYTGRSLLKAQRVLEERLIAHEAYKAREIRRKENYEINKSLLEVKKEQYIGKAVMIKSKGSVYIKAEITNLYPTYKLGVFSFSTKVGYSSHGNSYLTSREGKNWYYWTREQEIIDQREALNKELRELRKVKKTEEEKHGE